jgi:hypothetical protein
MIAGAVAIAPLLWGEPLLDQVVVSWDIPVLGTVKTGSALLFDLGVVAIVVGLVVALLDGLDAESLVDHRPHGGAPSTDADADTDTDALAGVPTDTNADTGGAIR